MIRYCKCGHQNKLHEKSWLGVLGQCTKSDCKCNRYLRNTKPDLVDKITVPLGIILLIGLSVPLVILSSLYFSLTDETYNLKMVNITLGEYLFQGIVSYGLIVFMLSVILYSLMISDYFRYKKRRTFDKED